MAVCASIITVNKVHLFTYSYEGGDDDDAGNEISSANSYGVTVGYRQVC
ncbi:hypothetical protein [Sphaerospermopsis sp. LEGE 08334]|nr:hypothetical protein [Sphaerospermopsis sp. LEGE 08334]MBE9058474.1 hypothetical protein [Sphaerospermopsis sp. LEGE 08334]